MSISTLRFYTQEIPSSKINSILWYNSVARLLNLDFNYLYKEIPFITVYELKNLYEQQQDQTVRTKDKAFKEQAKQIG